MIGQNYASRTTDTYLALPTIKSKTVKEYVYYVMSVNSPNSYSGILIVVTEDNTVLRVKVTQSTTIYHSHTRRYGWRRYRTYYDYSLSAGSQYSFTFNRLETRYMQTSNDLSGTKIVTNKPVSIFSGHRCAYVPYNHGNCGYMIEQIPPVTFWGTVHYTTPLATRRSYTIKVLAAFDGTNITIYCNDTAQSYTLNEQKHLTRTLYNQEYCIIYSNKKVLVAQFSGRHGEDPSMTLVSPSKNFVSKLQFSTFQHATYYYPNYVNIIVMAQYYQPDSIYLKAGGLRMSLSTQEWTPIRASNNTEAYATKVTVLSGTVEIIHTNIAALMTAIVYGVAARNGYIHSGGLSITVGKYACLYIILYIFILHTKWHALP